MTTAHPSRLLFRCLILSAALFDAAVARADVTEALDYRYYQARVTRDEPLVSSLLRATPVQEGGQPYLGQTNWNLSWNLTWRFDGSGRCTMQSVRTHLKATITLPQKSPKDTRASASFAPFALALQAHELRHLAIAREAAKTVDRRLTRLPTMPHCNALEKMANEIGESALREARQKGRDYDARTDHGRTEGVYLNQ